MRTFFLRWLITTIAVLVAAHLVPGIHYEDLGSLFVASLVLGLVNAVLKPILMLLSLPLLLFTFGLFTLVINSALFLLVGELVQGFHVAGWGSAFWGSLVVSLVTILLKSFQFSQRNPAVSVTIKQSASSRKETKEKVIDV